MVEIMTRDISGSDLKDVVQKLYVIKTFDLLIISIFLHPYFRKANSIGLEIEKVCRGIYPLQNVNIRKVKVLKKPKFDGKMMNETLKFPFD